MNSWSLQEKRNRSTKRDMKECGRIIAELEGAKKKALDRGRWNLHVDSPNSAICDEDISSYKDRL